ncbi:MAG: pyrroline-5-carboxylate reductase [Bacteroidota bacterium]
MKWKSLAIIGAGNLGTAIADGIVASGLLEPSEITLTRRSADKLEKWKSAGFTITRDNAAAVHERDIILIAVEPHALGDVVEEFQSTLNPERHLLISVMAGVTMESIRRRIRKDIPIVRTAPNTAVERNASMTTLCSLSDDPEALETARKLFEPIGETLIIDESMMAASTALCASGIAFFIRGIRAAALAGTRIGFSPDESIRLAAQTALGAAKIVLESDRHPEAEIDRVTTPGGCTIQGLNRMEENGFSSSMIDGIVHASEIAQGLGGEE